MYVCYLRQDQAYVQREAAKRLTMAACEAWDHGEAKKDCYLFCHHKHVHTIWFSLNLCTCQFQVKLIKVTGRISSSLVCALVVSSYLPTMDQQCGYLFLWELWLVSVRPGTSCSFMSLDGEPSLKPSTRQHCTDRSHWDGLVQVLWFDRGFLAFPWVWTRLWGAPFSAGNYLTQQELHVGTKALVGKAENCVPQWHI